MNRDNAELLGLIVGVVVFALVLVDGWWFVTETPPWRSRPRRVAGYVIRAAGVILLAPIAATIIGLGAFVVALILGSL